MQSLPCSAKIENMDPNAQPNTRLVSDDRNTRQILKTQTRVLKFSKSLTPNVRIIYKTRISKLKRGVHHARVWRTWDLKVNKLAFHQLTRKSHLQSMDAWILRKRFPEGVKRRSPFMASDDRIPRKQTLNMAKVISYLKKSSLKVGLHSPRHDHEST